MQQDSTHQFPDGLPQSLVSGNKSFDRLCELLGITTRIQKKHLVAQPLFKQGLREAHSSHNKTLHTVERWKRDITQFYESTQNRRNIWNRIPDITKLSPNDAGSLPLPSLELNLLLAYDEHIFTGPLDQELINTLLRAPNTTDDINESQRPLLAALSKIHSDHRELEGRSTDIHHDPILATFAIASILDDARIIETAIAANDDLKQEFSFLTNSPNFGSGLDTVDQPPEQQVATDLPRDFKILQEKCKEMRNILTLIEQSWPTRDLMNKLSAISSEVQRKGQYLLSTTTTLTDANRKIDQILEIIGRYTEEVPWIRAESSNMHACWKLVYLDPKTFSLDKLNTHLDQLNRNLSPAIEAWKSATNNATALEERMAKTPINSRISVIQQQTTTATFLDLARRAAEARESALASIHAILDLLSPNGHDYDANRQYVEEWKESPYSTIYLLHDNKEKPNTSESNDDSPKAEHQSGSTQRTPDSETISLTSLNSINTTRPNVLPSSKTAALQESNHDVSSSAPTSHDNCHSTQLPAGPDEFSKPIPDQPPLSLQSGNAPMETVRQSRENIVLGSNSGLIKTHDSLPNESNTTPITTTVPELLVETSPIITAIWELIDDNRLGLAYHIGRLLSNHPDNSRLVISPYLLEALAYSRHITGPSHPLFQDYIAVSKQFPDDKTSQESTVTDATNILILAATLRPALLAPRSGVVVLIRRVNLSQNFQPLLEFSQAIIDATESVNNFSLDQVLLESLPDDTDWKTQYKQHTAEVSELKSSSPQRKLMGPAQRVWEHWHRRDQIVNLLFDAISSDNAASVPRVEELLGALEPRAHLDKLIHETHLGLTTGSRRKRIEARSLTQLHSHVAPIIDLSHGWLRLVRNKSTDQGYLRRSVRELRNIVESKSTPTLRAINSQQGASSSIYLSAALKQLKITIHSITDLFSQDSATGSSPTHRASVNLTKNILMNQDLIYVTDLKLTLNGSLSESIDDEELLRLLSTTSQHATTISQAFQSRLENRDLTGARLASDMMSNPAVRSDALQALESVIVAKSTELKRAQQTIVGLVEQAYCLGQISEEERNDLNTKLSSIRQTILGKADQIVQIEHDLEAITTSLNCAKEEKSTKCSAELEEVNSQINAIGRSRLRDAIRDGDFVTFNELITQVRNGDLIETPDDGEEDFLAQFYDFLASERTSSVTGADSSASSLVEAAVECRDLGHLKFSKLSKQEGTRAGDLLRAWFNLQRVEIPDRDHLTSLFSALGFQVKNVGEVDDNSARLKTEPLRDRRLCPFHLFGSAAKGNYRVVLNRKTQGRESLIQSATETTASYTFVLHFAPLGDARHWFRDWAIENQRLVLVVDESLALFLATLPASRLHALFLCTFPFSAAEPFVTTSSLVPPEMFYGRRREREDVMESFGACFVYGGRQLGKTALLRSAEAEFHRPNRRQIAKWIDLKVREIGYARTPDQIWRMLWQEFTDLDLGVVPQSTSRQLGTRKLASRFVECIESWIGKDEESRILLMLDEADEFLRRDAEADYRESTQLKGLMERTERRFKVVFSGLHNVLRTTERANHPLAHLGSPICIGPLMSDGEWKNARSLIGQPLEVIGFKEIDENALTHVLAQTNYYPSLIQLYGAGLVRYLRRSTTDMPVAIKISDIYDVFRLDDLRGSIRDRFLLTLQLDPRYEVISYAMVYELDESELSVGLDSASIAVAAREWWPDGFEMPDLEFLVLLDEMVGLGVLRRVNHGEENDKWFTFRNPNVVALLGSADEIVRVLTKKREDPQVFEASSFHRHVEGDYESPQRCPLTFEQEGNLRKSAGVTIISGTEASSISLCADSLIGREGEFFQSLAGCISIGDLLAQISKLRPDDRQGVHVYFVSLDTPWCITWVNRVVVKLRQLRRGRWIRVVFIADPSILLNLLKEVESGVVCDERVDWPVLRPWNRWFLRRWCEDNVLIDSFERVSQLLEVSGGWPSVVVERFSRSKLHSWDSRISELRDWISVNRGRLLESLGVDSTDAEQETEHVLDILPLSEKEARELFVNGRGLAGDVGLDSSIRRRFEWCKRIGLIQLVDHHWSCNSLVTRLFKKSGD